MKRLSYILSLTALGVLLNSCGGKVMPDFNQLVPGDNDGGNTSTDPGTPSYDVNIEDYDGETADDAANDVVGTDEDIFWELNDFSKTVTVYYNPDQDVTVTSTDDDILYRTDGDYVTIDMQTNSVKGVEIVVLGTSSDGQLKIYGDKKFKLTLSGLDLTCKSGPAINDQCHKRAFVHLTEGTSNYLTDASSYSDDPYYLSSSSSSDEDRKGCLFSEGNLIFSGTGSLIVNGNYRHGIATDGYFYMRPGVTVVVQSAAKNAIQVKGDEDDGYGVYVAGGLIYANVSGTAGKCVKTDYNAVIAGGKLDLNTSGGSEYDSDEQDTSSPSCIKTDGDLLISGGTISAKSTGTGGKGLKADGALTVSGGTVTVATSGAKFVYSSSMTSSPKGIRADGALSISGGSVSVSVTGKTDGSEGIESKSTISIDGGEVYVYAYDDAINASKSITISDGKVYAYGVNNDGIDSNGTLTINGGLVLSNGTNAPEEGLDTDQSSNFKINGGTVIGTGGSQSSPSTSSSQWSVIYSGISASDGLNFCILDSSSSPIMTYTIPRTMNGLYLIYSGSNLTSGTYTVETGGTITGYSDSWNGWYKGGTWSGGTSLGTFTASSTVTSAGGSGSGGGNVGGGNNGGGNTGGGSNNPGGGNGSTGGGSPGGGTGRP